MTGYLRPDDVVYLVPILPTAPAAAYQMPRCTVLRVDGPRVTIHVDGREITTDARNIRRTRPEPEPPGPRVRPRPPMPEGYAEVTLW